MCAACCGQLDSARPTGARCLQAKLRMGAHAYIALRKQGFPAHTKHRALSGAPSPLHATLATSTSRPHCSQCVTLAAVGLPAAATCAAATGEPAILIRFRSKHWRTWQLRTVACPVHCARCEAHASSSKSCCVRARRLCRETICSSQVGRAVQRGRRAAAVVGRAAAEGAQGRAATMLENLGPVGRCCLEPARLR